MLFRTVGRRWSRLAVAGALLYAAFAVLAPFAHHDLSCELKTPQHCTACASSLLGTDANGSALPVAPLADAGRAEAIEAVADGVLLAVRSTGRSPPPLSSIS
jgi:hypothetical protein